MITAAQLWGLLTKNDAAVRGAYGVFEHKGVKIHCWNTGTASVVQITYELEMDGYPPCGVRHDGSLFLNRDGRGMGWPMDTDVPYPYPIREDCVVWTREPCAMQKAKLRLLF